MEKYGYVKDNYARLKDEIFELCLKCGSPTATLVAVTKSGSDEEVVALAEAGASDFGENRPQLLKARDALLRESGFTPRMHEIGNLQKNKVKMIIESVSLIHSLDSLALAEEIDKQAKRVGRCVPVLIEVNSAREESKGGVLPEEAEELLLKLGELRNIEVFGLMTMGPVCEDYSEIRKYFRLTRKLFEDLRDKYGFKDGGILSMGMSDSYRIAIEEGSTLVRVGRRLFEK